MTTLSLWNGGNGENGIKNCRENAPKAPYNTSGKTVKVECEKVISALKKTGYDGALTLELDYKKVPCLESFLGILLFVLNVWMSLFKYSKTL